jgi:hypothetical protein
LARF